VTEAECRYTKGYYAAHDGRLHEAAQHLAAAVALLQDAGRAQRAMVIELSLHTALLWTGQARLALERQRDALQPVLDAGSPNLLAILMMRQADSELSLGDTGAAGISAGRALEALRATDMIGGELARTTWYVSDVQRRRGRWDEALAIVTEMEQRLAAQSDVEQLLAAARAGIYLDLGRPDLAHRHIEAFAVASQHSARQRHRAQALRWDYALATGAGIETALVVADALRSENLLQACELVLVAGRAREPELVSAQCAALVARCQPEGLRLQLAPLHALCARLALREGDAPSAHASVALAREALLQGDVGAATPLAGLWLAQALQGLGRAAEAAQQARQAATWVTDHAQDAVPLEFRDSFLQRNPVHAALLSWPV
jgi:hypothetical protein